MVCIIIFLILQTIHYQSLKQLLNTLIVNSLKKKFNIFQVIDFTWVKECGFSLATNYMFGYSSQNEALFHT